MSIATTAENETGVQIEVADDADVRATLDTSARRWLGISGEEFLTKLAAGEYEGADTAALHRLLSIAALLG